MSTVSVYLSKSWRIRHGRTAVSRNLLIYSATEGRGSINPSGDPACPTWWIRHVEHRRQPSK
jgi:hypothetical protein